MWILNEFSISGCMVNVVDESREMECVENRKDSFIL